MATTGGWLVARQHGDAVSSPTLMPSRLPPAAIALACALLLGVLSGARVVLAQSATVPSDMQAELVAKLETYDRGFAGRAGTVARILVVTRPGYGRSEASASDIRAALSRVDRIGGLPHQEVVASYAGAEALAQRCRAEQIAVVYVTPGFDEEIDAIKTSLATVPVLTVTPVADYVSRGIVLGFELEAGRARILLNLAQARSQGINFPADVIRLMKVFR